MSNLIKLYADGLNLDEFKKTMELKLMAGI